MLAHHIITLTCWNIRPHLIQNWQKSTHLYQKAVETLFMDFAHCVYLWNVYLFIFCIHYLFIYVFLFFQKSRIFFLALCQIICLFMVLFYFQKCYVFRHCALCKTDSSQWSVFETDITLSWINTNTVKKHFFASSVFVNLYIVIPY